MVTALGSKSNCLNANVKKNTFPKSRLSKLLKVIILSSFAAASTTTDRTSQSLKSRDISLGSPYPLRESSAKIDSPIIQSEENPFTTSDFYEEPAEVCLSIIHSDDSESSDPTYTSLRSNTVNSIGSLALLAATAVVFEINDQIALKSKNKFKMKLESEILEMEKQLSANKKALSDTLEKLTNIAVKMIGDSQRKISVFNNLVSLLIRYEKSLPSLKKSVEIDEEKIAFFKAQLAQLS